MITVQSRPLGQEWKERLSLSTRKAPELYENADEVRSTPHAGAIRTTLRELNASAVFCIHGSPTVTIISVDDYARREIVELHAALWNQGLSSLLLVLSDAAARAFSLARIPHDGENADFDRRCLVQTLNAATHSLALKDFIYGAESGRLWEMHAEYFPAEERIDKVLLRNLTVSHRQLLDIGLSSDAAQALLIQSMFIAYLEDREITSTEYFRHSTRGMADNFLSLLKSDDVDLINIVFKKLRADFNGDLFVAPCSFVATDPHPILEHSHLEILARFRSGRVEMGTGQYRFWGYNFKYIPIELISAVYDRFLGEQKVERRNQGAYYTPMFLADTAISQVWDQLSHKTITDGRFLDPSCGSGMFLVRTFQRLCEHWRETRQSQTIHWNSLLEILSRLRGWDRDSGAVRVAVFSLYIALLEEVYPPDIQDLINSHNLLPKLWGQTLRHRDFFEPQSPDDDLQADVLIGNPPWSSRKGPDRSSVRWCRANQLPMPSNEDAWAFAWKSLHHLRDGGIVAFLLPAMGFLHNHSKSSVTARRRFIREARVIRIVNFADLRFQLFEGAVRPAALIVFRRADPQTHLYRFEYWTPKADLNLKGQRRITLRSADKCMIASGFVERDPSIFKRRLWMSAPEAKLFNYLSAIPKLGDLVSSYGEQYRKGHLDRDRWWIGQGFQPFNADRSDRPDAYFDSQLVGRLPHLSIDKFEPLAQPVSAMSPWPSNRVRRKGFERGFTGPRVLVPRGVLTTPRRLRATYLEEPLTFQHIIQAIVVPPGEAHRAKLLAALLNSRVILWYGFHGTASFGAERPEVKQADLLLLPFPSPNDLPEQKRSQSAENGLISLVEEALQSQSDPFQATENTIFEDIDRLAYEFFCLSDREIVLVDDTVERMIPAVQPRRSSFPEIWEPSNYGDRLDYANTLIHNMSDWFDSYYSVEIRLEAHNEDLAILRLSLQETRENAEYVEKDDISVSEALSKLSEHIEQPLPGNFQLLPDFRLFIDKDLYLVKSIQKRFWMRSAAISDADAIALDLQDASGLGIEQSPA